MKISQLCALLIVVCLVVQLSAQQSFGSKEGFVGDDKESVGLTENERDEMYFMTGETVPPREIDWEERAQYGSNGNVTVYKDKKGVPVAVYVLGVTDIPEGVTKIKGREIAQKAVERSAKKAFALWMKECISTSVNSEEKTLVVNANGKAVAQSTTTDEEKFTQAANACWRGMEPYWHKTCDNVYICVWRWTLNGQKMAKLVELLTQDGVNNHSSIVEDGEGFLRDTKRRGKNAE